MKFIRNQIEHFFSRKGVAHFQKSLNYLMSERFLRIIISFLIHPLLVRYLGPEKYGLYGYTISLFVIFHSIVSYGFEDQVVKDLIQKKYSTNTIISSVLCFKLILTVISYILLITTATIYNSEGSEVLTLSLIIGLYSFSTILVPFESYQQSQMNFKLISLSRVYGFIISNSYKIILIFMKLPLHHVAIAYVLEVLISQFIIFKRTQVNLLFKPSLSYISRILKITWPLLITLFVINFAQKISIFFLEAHSNIETVGYFSVIQSLIKYIEVVPMTILTVILPKIIETKSRDKGQYHYRLSAVYFVMTGLSFAAFIFFYFSSDFIVSILYGDKFDLVAKFLPWAALVSSITFINFAKAKHFLLDKLTIEWMIYNTISMGLIYLLCSIWIPKQGIMGAFGAYFYGYFIADILVFAFIKKIRTVYLIILKSFIFPLRFMQNKIKS